MIHIHQNTHCEGNDVWDEQIVWTSWKSLNKLSSQWDGPTTEEFTQMELLTSWVFGWVIRQKDPVSMRMPEYCFFSLLSIFFFVNELSTNTMMLIIITIVLCKHCFRQFSYINGFWFTGTNHNARFGAWRSNTLQEKYT